MHDGMTMNNQLRAHKTPQTISPYATEHHDQPPREASSCVETPRESLSHTSTPSSPTRAVRPDTFELARPHVNARAQEHLGEKSNSSGGIQQSLRLAELMAAAVFRSGAKAHAALATATKAVAENPAEAKARVLRGLLYLQNEANDEAILDFDAALRIDSSNRTALLHRSAAMRQPKTTFSSSHFMEAAKTARHFAVNTHDDRFAILLLIADWHVLREHDTQSPLARRLLDADPLDRCAMSALMTMDFRRFQMFHSTRMETSAMLSAHKILRLWPDDKIARSVLHHCRFQRSEARVRTKVEFQTDGAREGALYDEYQIWPYLILRYPLIEQDRQIFAFLGG